MTDLTAVGLSEASDRAHAQQPTDVIVTAASHPTIFECLEDISHDCGGGAGHTCYSIPIEWAGYLTPEHEAAVAALSDEERSTFCIGEETEMEAIARCSPLLERVSVLLSAFHEDFEDDDWRSTLQRVDELLPAVIGLHPSEELSLSDVRRVAGAITAAEQPGHEGPFGLFNYTSRGDPVPHHVRDFRMRAEEYGSCLHRTADQGEARQLYDEATRLHVALAATRTALHLPRPGQRQRDSERMRSALIAAYLAGATTGRGEGAEDYASQVMESLS